MCNFFKYLDRFYVKRHNKKPLQEVAINKFRTLIFDGVKARAVNAIGELVTRDRNREEVDRDLLRDAIQVYYYLISFYRPNALSAYLPLL
jgi:hypothetical protein